MLTDNEARGNLPAIATGSTSGTGCAVAPGSREVALISGTERATERPSPFGPVRTYQRQFVAETTEALGLYSSLANVQAQYVLVSGELRAFAEAAAEREAWWRSGVETLEMSVSTRDADRRRLLEMAERDWTQRFADMSATAEDAVRRGREHAEVVETQSAKPCRKRTHIAAARRDRSGADSRGAACCRPGR